MHSFFKKLFLINTVCSLMLHQPAKTFFVAADAAVDLVCMTIFQLVYPFCICVCIYGIRHPQTYISVRL